MSDERKEEFGWFNELITAMIVSLKLHEQFHPNEDVIDRLKGLYQQLIQQKPEVDEKYVEEKAIRMLHIAESITHAREDNMNFMADPFGRCIDLVTKIISDVKGRGDVHKHEWKKIMLPHENTPFAKGSYIWHCEKCEEWVWSKKCPPKLQQKPEVDEAYVGKKAVRSMRLNELFYSDVQKKIDANMSFITQIIGDVRGGEVVESRIKPERMDHVDKGALVGKPREVKK